MWQQAHAHTHCLHAHIHIHMHCIRTVVSEIDRYVAARYLRQCSCTGEKAGTTNVFFPHIYCVCECVHLFHIGLHRICFGTWHICLCTPADRLLHKLYVSAIYFTVFHSNRNSDFIRLSTIQYGGCSSELKKKKYLKKAAKTKGRRGKKQKTKKKRRRRSVNKFGSAHHFIGVVSVSAFALVQCCLFFFFG